MRKLVSLFTVLMLASMLVFAQNRPITGKVVDESGQPVSGASIVIKGSKGGASADASGSFTINAKTGDVLLVSAVGAAAKEVTVMSGSSVSVILPKQSSNLSEVVITTALGIQRQAKSLGISTANVKSAELIQARPVNLQNGLTGKISGLNIQTVNNGVFADTRITLRGIRSLTGNNQPMFILDGIPLSLSYINSVNPNDVADVSILKSSSATAIYGPEGVNGAIVITTKKGNSKKPTISVSHTTQVEAVSFMPKLQTQFGSGSSVDAYGYAIYDQFENQCYGPAFDGSIKQIGRDDPNGNKYLVDYTAKPDEKKKFWDHGITNQTDISFSTGDFYLSAQNVDIKGTMPKDENHRKTVRLSANKEYGKFKAIFNVNYTLNNSNTTAGSSFSSDYQPYWLLINTPMQVPVTKFKDWKNDYWSNPNGYFSDYYLNPYFAIDNFRNVARSNDLVANIELNYKATNWLSFIYRLGGTSTSATSSTTKTALVYDQFTKSSGKNIASKDIKASSIASSALSTRLNSEFFATAKKDFKDFRVEGLLGYSFREIRSNSQGINTTVLGIPAVFNSSVRQGEVTPSQSDQKNRLQRFFGRASVSYNNWAFLEATGSYDMDSRLSNPYLFNLKDISFFYPGANISVVLSDAIAALKNSKNISYLKVRAAISKTGNVNLGNYQPGQNTYYQPTGFPYSTLIGFSANNTLLRPTYKPEFVLNKEVGIEIGLLKNRINLEASYYTQDNTDQLITVAYSGSTGFPTALLNAAAFTNKGLELDLKLTPLVTIGKATVNFKVNYTNQSNKVTKLIDGVDELGIGNFNYIINGLSAYTFKMADYVRDPQGHVVINNEPKGLPTQDPINKNFGQTMPKHILGLNLSAEWKGVTLSIVADYRSGNQINAYSLGNAMDFTGISYRSAVNGRQPFIWPNSVIQTAPGKFEPNTSVYTTGGYDFYSQSINREVPSNYLASGAFWKLREVSIGYVMPAKWFAKTSVRGATFTLSGRNLAMWLPKTNQWTDPEFSTTTGNAQGVSGLGNTPPTRLFGANLTVNF